MEEEDEDQHNTDATSAAPSTSDVMTAIDTLRRFLYAAPSSDAAQEQLMAVESFVIYGRRHYTQTALTDYFPCNQ